MRHAITTPSTRPPATDSARARPRRSAFQVLAAFVAPLLIAACGGSEPPPEGAASDGPERPPLPATSNDVPAPDPAPGDATASIPTVHFAAHGPAPRVYGPGCGEGTERTGSDVFRLTAPEGWTYRGTSGGTGADEMSFQVNGSRVTVDLYATREEMRIETDFEDRGPTGLTVDLPGASVPLHEVAVDGRTGYGFLHLPWLTDMPAPAGTPPRGNAEGSVLITAREPGVVSAEDAAAVLSTARVERCAAVSRLLVYGPAAGVMPVPEFEGGDPLGKTRPDEPHPAYVPGTSPLLTYSETQVAYLLPLEAETARCVAPLVREDAPGDPILHLKVLLPSGTMKEVLAGYAARCG